MPLFRKKPKSQGERLCAWRIDQIPSRSFDPEIEALLAELDLPAEHHPKGWAVSVGGGQLLLTWLDEDRVFSGFTFMNDTQDAVELVDLLRHNLDPWLLWYALEDPDGDALGARFKLPFDSFDRPAALLAIETMASLMDDDAAAARARELRLPERGEMAEQTANARARAALVAGLGAAGLEASESDGTWEVQVERGVVNAIPRDSGESVLFMHELAYEEGTENVAMLRWMLALSDWSGARIGLAELPGGEAAFAAAAVSAADLQPQAVAWGVEQVVRVADVYDEKTGRA
jgi:hypothetical protein